MKRAMEASHLARLSPELRNAVYECVFTSDYATTLQNGSIQHALTRTCRQLRYETLGLFYNRTRFNAHLDDGPALPLAQWLKTVGRDQCQLLNEVNIWDMHMLNATLHGLQGETSTQKAPPVVADEGTRIDLRPLGSWLLDRGWYLKDLIIALYAMRLGIRMFCLIPEGHEVPKLTSHFAIVPLVTRCSSYPAHGPHAELMELLAHLGFNEDMQDQALLGLANPEARDIRLRELRVRKGRRDFFLRFDGEDFISVRQTFIPHYNDFVF